MTEANKTIIPKHVAIIMDGNRRWAKERNLNTLEGHRKGYEVMRRSAEWFFNLGVDIVTVYAFSTENWNRSQDEVNYLMMLFRQAIGEDLKELGSKGYKVLVSGRLDQLPGDLNELCQKAMAETAVNTKGTLNVCLNYGGRAELADAFKKISAKGVETEQNHEGMIKKHLYQPDLPDPDIIVRTSGEQRLSGFLMWQGAYSELLFMKKYWPDFERSDAEFVVEEFGRRQRRFGGDS